MNQPKPRHNLACSLCGESASPMSPCLDGFVCEVCAELTRNGRDNTSRALKTQQLADQQLVLELQGAVGPVHIESSEFAIAAGQLMAQDLHETFERSRSVSGGEAINPKVGGLVDTLTEPTVAALEASNHRTDLLTMLGNDIAALALDAAGTIEAANSLEKMLAHQMAAIHDASMRMVHRANLTQDPGLAAKTLNSAMKGFSAYQGAVGALRQLRGNQQQHIVVQHVNVGAGGQAMVGTVNTRGGRHD